MTDPNRVLLVAVNYNNAIEIDSYLTDLAGAHSIHHTIVVDDGSTDGSADIAEKKGFQVLRHGHNRGIGAAIRTGIYHALKNQNQYEAVAIVSCNGKMRPTDLPAILKPILNGNADYVQGNRTLPGGGSQGLPWTRRLGIPLFSAVTSLFLGRRFSDVTCGFRAYKLSFVKDPRMNIDQPWLDRYELEYYLHYWACRWKLRIVEVPVTIVYEHLRPGRTSKIVPFIGWWSMLRPFLYLGLGLRK